MDELSPGLQVIGRTAAAIPLWLVRSWLQTASGDPTWWSAIVGVALVTAHWWALQPKRRELGRRFGEHGHKSAFLFVPVIVAGALTIGDFFQLANGVSR